MKPIDIKINQKQDTNKPFPFWVKIWGFGWLGFFLVLVLGFFPGG